MRKVERNHWMANAFLRLRQIECEMHSATIWRLNSLKMIQGTFTFYPFTQCTRIFSIYQLTRVTSESIFSRIKKSCIKQIWSDNYIQSWRLNNARAQALTRLNGERKEKKKQFGVTANCIQFEEKMITLHRSSPFFFIAIISILGRGSLHQGKPKPPPSNIVCCGAHEEVFTGCYKMCAGMWMPWSMRNTYRRSMSTAKWRTCWSPL